MKRMMAAVLFLVALHVARGGVEPGASVLLRDSLHLVTGARIGVVCNHTAVLPDGRHLLDALAAAAPGTLRAVFTPEHGLTGAAAAGRAVSDTARGGLPVYSLFGATRKPTPAMLRGIDVLIVDLQDVGARYYTYVSTLALCMEAAAAQRIRLVVLDRPNPVGGLAVEGPVLDTALRSFVGLLPVPVRHGMTIGELARAAAGERWIRGADSLDLHVVPMRGWKRAMFYDDTGLPWVAPSPNIPDLATALVYPGMCLVEASSASEGRGTSSPFLQTGAPDTDAAALRRVLKELRLPGVSFDTTSFTPATNASLPKHAGRLCTGVRLLVTDRLRFRPVLTGAAVLYAFTAVRAPGFETTAFLDRLAGESVFARRVSSPKALREAAARWEVQCADFSRLRTRYLLYL